MKEARGVFASDLTPHPRGEAILADSGERSATSTFHLACVPFLNISLRIFVIGFIYFCVRRTILLLYRHNSVFADWKIYSHNCLVFLCCDNNAIGRCSSYASGSFKPSVKTSFLFSTGIKKSIRINFIFDKTV